MVWARGSKIHDLPIPVVPGGSQGEYDKNRQRLDDKASTAEGRNIYGPQTHQDYARQGMAIGELGGAFNVAKRAADGRDFNAWAAEQRARDAYAGQMQTNMALASSVPMARRAAMQRAAAAGTTQGRAALNNQLQSANAAYMGAARDRLGDINDARMRAALEARGQTMGADEFQATLNQGRRQFYEGQLLNQEASKEEAIDREMERVGAAQRAEQDATDRQNAAAANTAATMGTMALSTLSDRGMKMDIRPIAERRARMLTMGGR